MADIDEGVYLVVNAKSGLALDVKGGGDAAGTNVQQWTPNGSDAQMWAVTQQDDGAQLICSLTGKSLDVAGGRMANGANVQQWADNDSGAQRWDIAADGGTMTYKGASYPTCVLLNAKDPTYALDVTSGGTTAGANVQIYTANGTDAQRWALVPVPAMTEGGTYELVSALDQSMCVDIPGASTANNAKAQVYRRNGSNAQVFEAVVDAESMVVQLVNASSGKALDVSGAKTDNNTPVVQYAPDASKANQQWLAVQRGSMKVDGATVPTYELRSQLANGKCMDVAGGKATNSTKLVIYARNGTAAQRFALVKTETTGSGIPAPTSFSRVVAGRGLASASPTFTCAETAYQARTRRRSYRAGDHGTYEQTEWSNLVDGSTARGGWGDAWSPTFTAQQGGTVGLPVPVTAELAADGYDLVEVDVEVRAFREGYGQTGSRAHGPSTLSTITFSLEPDVTVGGVVMGEGGVNVALSCDLPYQGNRYECELWAGGSRIGRASAIGSGSCEVCVPFGSLAYVPADGETVEVRASVATDHGVAASATAQAQVAWTGGVTEATVTQSHEDGTLCAIVSCADAAGGTCLLEVAEAGAVAHVACPEVSPGQWRVPYPLAGTSRATVMARSGTGWVAGSVEIEPPDERCYVWNWGEGWGQCCRLRANADDMPTVARTHDPQAQVAHTSGRSRPVAYAGPSSGLDLSVNAVTFGDTVPHGTRADVERLARSLGAGWYPVFRTPWGDWHRVAVTGAETGREAPGYDLASVEQQAVQP